MYPWWDSVDKELMDSGLFKSLARLGMLLAALAAGGEARAERQEFLSDAPAKRPAGGWDADRCTTKELRSPALEAPRRQTDTQWCYAFSAADMLSWELGERVSAADIAILYNDGTRTRKTGQMHSQVQRGGWPPEAMELALSKGVCRERDMPSQDYLVRTSETAGKDVNLRILLEEIEGIKKSQSRRSHTQAACNHIEAVQAIFPFIDLPVLIEILGQATAFDFVNKLQERNCGARRLRSARALEAVTVRGPRTARFSPAVQARLFDRIDERLESGKITGLSIRGDFYPGYTEDDGHAATVTGRRWNAQTRECEYQVRESAFADPDTGYTWVSERSLSGKLFDVHFLAPARKGSK